MRTYLNNKQTFTPTSSTELRPQRQGVSLVQRLWQRLTAYLLQGSSLRIWQSRDSAGIPRWNVFDARTNRSATLLSEDDVRVWIEESYDYVPPKDWFLRRSSDSWIYQSDR